MNWKLRMSVRQWLYNEVRKLFQMAQKESIAIGRDYKGKKTAAAVMFLLLQ